MPDTCCAVGCRKKRKKGDYVFTAFLLEALKALIQKELCGCKL